jgi:hypothetical protein
MKYTTPPEDGSFEPSPDNEPTSEQLNELWEFRVVTSDTQLVVDETTRTVLYAYPLRGDSLGVWAWKSYEVHEGPYECPDPKCDYDHSGEVEFHLLGWGMNKDGVETFVPLASYEDLDSALLSGWYAYYASLQSFEY